jgi:hypothetical protein
MICPVHFRFDSGSRLLAYMSDRETETMDNDGHNQESEGIAYHLAAIISGLATCWAWASASRWSCCPLAFQSDLLGLAC